MRINTYQTMAQEGLVAKLASEEKQREAQEKAKDIDAQKASIQALTATIEAQKSASTSCKVTAAVICKKNSPRFAPKSSNCAPTSPKPPTAKA
jgi:hemolysin D